MTGAPDPEQAGQATAADPDGEHGARHHLERRIRLLVHADESEFGVFTLVDWIACVAGAVILPYLFVILFWP